MDQDKYTIALLQLAFSADVNDNLKKAVDWTIKAVAQGAQVICLPELYRSQYLCQSEDSSLFDLAETIPGPSTEAFQKIAREKQVAMVVPLFEKRARGLYHNSVVVFDAGGEQKGIYRKMHIPDDPAYYEKYYFTPGDLGFKAFDTRFGKIGTLICWDQWPRSTHPYSRPIRSNTAPSAVSWTCMRRWPS